MCELEGKAIKTTQNKTQGDKKKRLKETKTKSMGQFNGTLYI